MRVARVGEDIYVRTLNQSEKIRKSWEGHGQETGGGGGLLLLLLHATNLFVGIGT